jgi:Transglycosylase SLT domain
MRQLFVPACLCLMTISGSTGFDLPLETFPGAKTIDKTALMRTATADARDEVTADGRSDSTAVNDRSSFSEVDKDAPIDGLAPADLSRIDPSKIPLPPVPKPVVPRSREEICQTLSQAAQSNELPVPFFIRLLFQESRFSPSAVSVAGAQGIAQFMPETSASEGLDNPFDPLQAIPASARLLRKLIAQFGNLGLAAAAYNAGPKRIQDWLEKKGDLPEETQGYVKTVTGRPAETWKVASASGTALTVPRHAPCKEAVTPTPTPSPRAHTVTASAAKSKISVPPHGNDKTPRIAQGTPAKAEKVVETARRKQHKAPTQQLAARQDKSEAGKGPTKIAQQ